MNVTLRRYLYLQAALRVGRFVIGNGSILPLIDIGPINSALASITHMRRTTTETRHFWGISGHTAKETLKNRINYAGRAYWPSNIIEESGRFLL